MPLSNLFNKRNSTKDKKTNASQKNAAASAKCEPKCEDSIASTSGEQLPLPIEPATDVSSFDKKGAVSIATEVLPTSKNETAMDVSCDAITPIEDLALKYENTRNASLDRCNEGGNEISVSSGNVPQPSETVIDASLESIVERVQNDDCNSIDQTSTEEDILLDTPSVCKDEVKNEISIPSENHPPITETENSCSLSFNIEDIRSDGLESTEKLTPQAGDVQDSSTEIKSCTIIEVLSSTTEALTGVPCALSEEMSNVDPISSHQQSEKVEDFPDESLDSKTEENVAEASSISFENVSQKVVQSPDPVGISTCEVTRSESCQINEILQKEVDEQCPKFGEDNEANGNYQEEDKLSRPHTDCNISKEKMDFETRQNVTKSTKSSTRSASFKESGSKPTKSRRRKCESESAASNSTDDEGFDDKVVQFVGRDLEKVIEQCVNRLIRESIATAVRSVDVDSLCDEVMKSISDRSQSESSNFSESSETVEQKPHTNSVKEYVDIEVLDSFEDDEVGAYDKEKEIPQDEGLQGNSENKSGIEELKDAAGYQADLEESLSVHSLPMENEGQVKPDQPLSGNIIPEGMNCPIDNSVEGIESVVLESNEIPNASPNKNTEDVPTVDVRICSIDNTLEDEATDEIKSDVISKSVDISASDISESDTTIENVDISFKNSEIVQNLEDTNETVNSSLKQNDEEVTEPNVTKESVNSPPNPKETFKPDVKIEDVNNSLNPENASKRNNGMLRVDSEDLISISDDGVSELLNETEQKPEGVEEPQDLGVNIPQLHSPTEEEKKINWKAGYLHVKLPHKSRGKGHLKAWKKRCVSIQPDEFAPDGEPCVVVSVSEPRKKGASFWKSVSGSRAVVYRSSSGTHRYAFTVAEDEKPLLHLAADSEADAQAWMAAVRAVLWPPSPVVELEKMLNGSQFEVSFIDNDFSYRAGLLGMYGHLTVTARKLILVHPQQGYVVQEWYLNTVDRFELVHQTRIEDVHKVLCMTTCSDSSTGKGEILIFCREAVALLQALASTIHQILTHRSKQEGGKYQKELEEMAEWLVPSSSSNTAEAEDFYKVPPRQVRSLLDIPNFIFNKPLTPVATVACPSGVSMDAALSNPTPLGPSNKTDPTRTSQDSGISAGAASTDDFLNCSLTSFKVGPGKSSDSELSDSYTPPTAKRVLKAEKETL